MNLSEAGAFCRAPEEGDILISNGSHVATGIYDVVIKHPETGKLVLFPLRFLDEYDLDCSKSIHKISSRPIPVTCLPVGKLELKWTKRMI